MKIEITKQTRSFERVFYFGKVKKKSLLVVLILFSRALPSQELPTFWIPGEVHFKDGVILRGNLNFNNQIEEGLLLVKKQEKVVTFSPLRVNKFYLFDELMQDTLIYESVKTKFGNSSRGVFLNQIFKGNKYSIYKRNSGIKYLKPSLDSAKVANQQLVDLYARDNKAIFFIAKNNLAHQVTVSKGDARRRKYVVEKTTLLETIDEEKSILNRFINEKKLNIKRLYDMEMFIRYADSLSTTTK